MSRYTRENLEKAVANSKTYKEIRKNLGLKGRGTVEIKKYLKLYGIAFESDYSPNKAYFTKGKFIKSNTKTKRKLVEDEGWDYICSHCGLGESWNGKSLVLQLHHVNGDNQDNRKSNLEILCPNCHTQTDNHSGKKRSN